MHTHIFADSVPERIYHYNVAPTRDGGRHETFYKYNSLYREGGLPSSIVYDNDGLIVMEMYTDINGNYHRIDGPAIVIYHQKSRRIARAEYWINGKMNNTDGPAVRDYHLNGNWSHASYRDEAGKPHRDGPYPAEVDFDESGVIRREVYYSNGMQHRHEDMPSELQYNTSGELVFKCYCVNGKLHREGGPALIKLDNGSPVLEKWFSNGICVKTRETSIHQ